ncbi:MAG: ABC transporter permease [Deltaproteobacteria bacterium]|nr:ABC transporter permease [Deltaproteobacteria bacterium]
MLGVIGHIMKKEMLQASRDRRMLAIVFVAPVLQTLLFGFAINLDLKAQPTVVADLDRTATSRALSQSLANTDGFTIVSEVPSHAAAERAIVDGEAALAILIPRGFEHDLSQQSAELLVVMDGSDSNTALRSGQEATQILNQRAVTLQRQRVAEMLAAKNVAADRLLPELRLEARAWFNPTMRTAVYFVPAVFALVLMVITMLLTSMGLTREKEIGTLEQVMVTPIRRIDLMVGKTLPFALLGLADVAFIVAVAAWVFDVPVRGTILSLYGATGLFLMTTLGLGLFVSTISGTQQQAMLTSFFFILPALMLSGYMYPIENMPVVVQWLTVVNPLRYYIQLARGIMVKGAELFDLWRPALALTVLGAAVLASAALRFRKRLT